jgi:indolepyruvate ferredoxin oxidoreductase beta subunit
MSKRGGSVVTYVKFSDKVYSPIIDKGEADIILAFELLEAYRALPYLKKDGTIIINNQRINPMPVITGVMEYPENILENISSKVNTKCFNALELAKEAGNIKAVNVVLIGVLAKTTDIAYEKWVEVIKTTVPAKLLDVNLKAFDLGYNTTL